MGPVSPQLSLKNNFDSINAYPKIVFTLQNALYTLYNSVARFRFFMGL